METLTFQCGHCNKLMAVGAEFVGKQVRCPHCQQVVIAPQQPAPTSAQLEAARQPAQSALAVAADTPWWASPAVATSEASRPPSPTDTPGRRGEPGMEVAPAAPPAPFAAFEAAVDDSTPAVPTGTAVADPAGLQAESKSAPASAVPSGALPSAPDIVTPWGPEGAQPGTGPLVAPRPRRSQWGMTIFISLVFLPLLLYAVLVTILAVMFYQRANSGQQDPRQFLPDVEGDHPGFKRPNKQSLLPESYYTDPLPSNLRVALGGTLPVGDLEVSPQRVEWAKVHISLGNTGPFEVDNPALVLHLKLRNVSPEVTFYPVDAYFNRQWSGGEGEKPLTLVEAGPARYFGGPARWRAREPEVIEGTNCDKALGPGESGEYVVCTNCYDEESRKLSRYSGPLLWRVQVRRGRVRYEDKDLSATAVIGVEFTDKDVGWAAPRE
jgi:phage FluMu protein Com